MTTRAIGMKLGLGAIVLGLNAATYGQAPVEWAAPTNMAWIPAGTFTMGSPANEVDRIADETPHPVTLTQGFYMGKQEVTQGQYLGLVGSNPSNFTGDTNRPVEMVSWNDATNYCRLLTQADRAAGRIPANWRYRLPTEAEWEYACRAGTTTAFYLGSALHGGKANFFSASEYDAIKGDIDVTNPVGYRAQTTTVGSHEPNAFGLSDMHGNVWEWCQDWYGPYPSDAVVDPTGPATGLNRVFRGGSWISYGKFCRSAFRFIDFPPHRGISVGFRVVLAPGQ